MSVTKEQLQRAAQTYVTLRTKSLLLSSMMGGNQRSDRHAQTIEVYDA